MVGRKEKICHPWERVGFLQLGINFTYDFCHLYLLEVFMFYNQVDAMYTLFKANADKPPIFKNQPPVAGAISWERSLFLRIKHTILRFQEMEDMLNSEQGKLVRHVV